MSLPIVIEKRHKEIAKQLKGLGLTDDEKKQIAKEIDQFARLFIQIYKPEKTKR